MFWGEGGLWGSGGGNSQRSEERPHVIFRHLSSEKLVSRDIEAGEDQRSRSPLVCHPGLVWTEPAAVLRSNFNDPNGDICMSVRVQ